MKLNQAVKASVNAGSKRSIVSPGSTTKFAASLVARSSMFYFGSKGLKRARRTHSV